MNYVARNPRGKKPQTITNKKDVFNNEMSEEKEIL